MANSTFKPYVRKGGAAVTQAEYKGSLRYFPAKQFYWSQVIDFAASPGNVGATALAASTSQEIDLHVAFPDNLFPADVMMDGALVYLQTDCSGGSISALTIDVGDTGDPNGLVAGTDVFTGATNDWSETTSAAQHAKRLETAFVPTLTLNATGDNVDAITAGKFEIVIKFSPLPQPEDA